MGKGNKLLKTTMILTFIIILSKIAGFAREMIMASSFGLTVESDAYGVAYSILSIFTILFGAAIGSTFIPIYTKTQVNKGDLAANEYASNVFNLYVIVAILTSIVAYIFAPAITAVMWRNPEGGELVTSLTRFMLPSLVCWCISGVLVNLLDARKHFVPEQLIGFALSFCVIVGCLVFHTIEAVAIATAVTALMQVGILAPFLRGQFRWRPVLNLKSKQLQTTFLLALPALISVAFDEINHAADKIFGSEIGIGVVSSLTKSYTLVQTAISVLVIPITTVMFTQLSQYAAKKQMDELKNTVRSAIEAVAFITLPIIVLCLAVSMDIIAVFYQRGSFTYDDTVFTAPVFACYIAGIFGFGLRNFLTRVFYSLQKTRVPMYLGMISVTFNIVLDMLWKDTLGAPGLTLATSIASLTGAVLMIIVLRKTLGRFSKGRSAAFELIKIFVASGITGFVIYLVTANLPIYGMSFSAALTRVLAGVLVGVLVYFALAFAFRIRQTRPFLDMVRRRLGRGRRKPAPKDAAEALQEEGTPLEVLEPLEAMEAADFNYPGPQFMPQPPAYRTLRIFDEAAFETPYQPAAAVQEEEQLIPHGRRIDREDLSAKTQAFQIPDSFHPKSGPYSPTWKASAYEGQKRYRSREELERMAMDRYEERRKARTNAEEADDVADRMRRMSRWPSSGPAGTPTRRRIDRDDDSRDL